MIGKRTCGVGIAALAFSASPVMGAGLEGAYWGVNIGGFTAETETDQSLFKPQGTGGGSHLPTINGFNSLNPNVKQTSVTGGAQVGYNWRAGLIMLGAEFDVNYWRYRSQESATTSFVAGGGNTRILTSSNMTDGSLLMTLRPRLGYLISERALVYVSAGVAYSDLKYSNYSRAETTGGAGVTTQYFSQVSADSGKVFGLGYEQVWSDRMVLRIDYQNVTFDRVASNGNGGTGFNDLANSVLTTGYKTNVHIIRLGANWRF
jgi:outer membrane immunogenic protein